MRLAYHVMSSPVGLLFLVRSGKGLRHLDFMDRKSLKRMIQNRSAANPDAEWVPSLLDLKPVTEQLDEYFCGMRHTFDLPLDLDGTEFQQSVWRALLAVPFGRTTTYGAIAKAIRQPKAARAVGLANNQNPVPIIVPCHRIIGANGRLTGYGGGLPRKKWLLEHEAKFVGQEGSVEDRYAVSSERVGARRGR